MAQRCGFCGKTEKQHEGRTCIDPVLTMAVAKIKDDDYGPKGTDPLIQCPKCKVWSARKKYCSNCKELRK